MTSAQTKGHSAAPLLCPVQAGPAMNWTANADQEAEEWSIESYTWWQAALNALTEADDDQDDLIEGVYVARIKRPGSLPERLLGCKLSNVMGRLGLVDDEGWAGVEHWCERMDEHPQSAQVVRTMAESLHNALAAAGLLPNYWEVGKTTFVPRSVIAAANTWTSWAPWPSGDPDRFWRPCEDDLGLFRRTPGERASLWEMLASDPEVWAMILKHLNPDHIPDALWPERAARYKTTPSAADNGTL